MTGKRIQVYLDDIILEKWETFLNNNSAMFKNPTSLFRYMVSNIELLTQKNPNLISKDEEKVKDLQIEIEKLKIENLKLKSKFIESDEENIISLLNEINYKMDILEVINSTNLSSFPNIELVSSKSSEVYKKAKKKVDFNNKEVLSEKEVIKHNKLFDF